MHAVRKTGTKLALKFFSQTKNNQLLCRGVRNISEIKLRGVFPLTSKKDLHTDKREEQKQLKGSVSTRLFFQRAVEENDDEIIVYASLCIADE